MRTGFAVPNRGRSFMGQLCKLAALSDEGEDDRAHAGHSETMRLFAAYRG